MSDTFSKFFVMDEKSPEAKYTACMVLFIFGELQKGMLIDKDDANDANNKDNYKYCRRNIDFKIPKEYEHDTQNNGVTKHCLVLSYKYTGAGSFSKSHLIKNVCTLGRCEDKAKYDLNSTQLAISSLTTKYRNYFLSQKIWRKSTAS